MHIIIDATTTQDQFAYAGIGQYTKNVVCSLIEQYPTTPFSILLFADKHTTLCDTIYKHKNVKIVNLGKYEINDFKNDIWYYTKVLPKIKKIKQEDSIYFCPYFWRNYPANIMPVVLFVHDMNFPMFNMYSQKSKIHNQIRKVQYWMTLNKSMKCKKILCNSQTTKNDFLKYYPKYPEENVEVTYLGVDLEEKEVNIDKVLPKDYKERGYLLYMGGGINRSKNSEGVIKGYAQFLKLLKQQKDKLPERMHSKQPYLVIAGGKFQNKELKEVQELNELIKQEGVEENVIFTGFYEDDQKYSLLKNSFAFIHLSLYEGFGLSPIEALRAKVPTILHKNPVYEELFNDVAQMVDGTNPKEVGQVIYDVCTTPIKYKQQIEKAYEHSLKFTWSNTAKLTYEALLR
jgi:glycosyltransferase involved in cell wall biosynthesis